MPGSLARGWHGLTAAVAGFALLAQAILAVSGAAVLVPEQRANAWIRAGRLVSYFTVQSNVLVFVAVAVVALAWAPARDGGWFRAVRLAGLVGIAVTGIVHFFLLRPLLDLHGWSALCDALLHLVVPIMAILGWAAFGPRPRIDRRAIVIAFAWPIAWLAWTLGVGGATGWFPYPFLNFHQHSWAHVLTVCAGVTLLFGVLVGAVAGWDRRGRRAGVLEVSR